MKKIVLIGLVFIIGLISCSKNDDNLQKITGVFIEVSPVGERTEIEFLTENKMIINKSPQNGTGDEFTFTIIGNSIQLIPTWDNSSSSEFEFEIISDSKFKIENLYPDIPENSKTYMIFEK